MKLLVQWQLPQGINQTHALQPCCELRLVVRAHANVALPMISVKTVVLPVLGLKYLQEMLIQWPSGDVRKSACPVVTA